MLLPMQRRTLLQLPALASLAQASSGKMGFKLSVRVEAVFRDMNLPQMMEKVAEAGYQGFEFGNWRAQDPAEITKLKNKLGLECACLVGNRAVNPKGMTLVDPADRGGFLAEIRASTEAAKRFETTRLVTLTGNALPGVSRDAQHKSIVEGLKAVHDVVAPHGVTLIVEPLNTLVNHQGYYLDHTPEAFDIMHEVNSPNVKILFDIYHVQFMDGNLIATIRKNIGSIGHFHVGDVPGRHEPGTGEINYTNVFRAIRDAGFRDFVAMEYGPSKDPMATLAEVKAMAAR